MNKYFSLTIEEQRQILQATEGRIGLPAQAIEKDLWVPCVNYAKRVMSKERKRREISVFFGSP